MRFPLDIRLVPLVAIGGALLFLLSPALAVVAFWTLLGLLIMWLFFRTFSRPPRFSAEARFWPARKRTVSSARSKFFDKDPRPDTHD